MSRMARIALWAGITLITAAGAVGWWMFFTNDAPEQGDWIWDLPSELWAEGERPFDSSNCAGFSTLDHNLAFKYLRTVVTTTGNAIGSMVVDLGAMNGLDSHLFTFRLGGQFSEVVQIDDSLYTRVQRPGFFPDNGDNDLIWVRSMGRDENARRAWAEYQRLFVCPDLTDAQNLGDVVLFGRPVTHYRIEPFFKGYDMVIGSMAIPSRADIWVDKDGSSMKTQWSISQNRDGDDVHVEITWLFFDHGIVNNITAPPNFANFEDLMRAESEQFPKGR